MLIAFAGCTMFQKINPLSRSHGLPTQTETDED
jgi:hypothetical protein